MTALGHIGRSEKRLITAIVPAGRGQYLMERLSKVPAVLTVSYHHARGIGSRRVKPGHMLFDEKDVVMVLVEKDDADEVFASIYRDGRIGERHAGILYVEKILRGHPMLPFAADAPAGL